MNNILVNQVKGILEEGNCLAAMCNTTALIYEMMDKLNWCGFYFHEDDELVLGPFQGKIACTHIKIGKGVCGTAFEKQEVLNVKNVHEFPGHIACDCASNSEIVCPLGEFGVLDIDSPEFERFSEDDQETLTEIAKLITERIAKN